MKKLLFSLLLFPLLLSGQVLINPYALGGGGEPVNTVLPVISGNPQIDTDLTVSDGAWSNSPTSYSYQWKRDGVNITGQTASTYFTRIEDAATSITCTVTATNASGSTSATTNGTAITAQFPWSAYDDVAMYINPANTSTLFTGSAGAPATAPVNGDYIRLIYDKSKNASYFRTAATSTSVVKLQSDATFNGYFLFDGTDDYTVLGSSQSIFNPLHSSNPVFGIAFALKMGGSDLGPRVVFSSNNFSNSNIGFTILRNGSTKIQAEATYGSAGNYVWQATSTGNVGAATGWVWVIIDSSGSGTGTGRMKIYKPDGTVIENSTFNVGATGTTSDPTTAVYFGTRSGLTNYLNGTVGPVVVLNRPFTNPEITELLTLNPTRTASEFAPVLSHWYDFDDTSYMYSDAAATTPVVANDAVRVVKSKTTENFGNTKKRLTSVDVGTSPVFKTSIQNGKNVVQYDGVDDNFDLETTMSGELGGKWTMFVIGKNSDNSNGSHFLKGGDYLVVTGQNYGGSLPNPYSVAHTDPVGLESCPGLTLKGTSSDFFIIALRRNGTSFKMWNGLKQSSTQTVALPFSATDMGIHDFGSGTNTWNIHGYYGLLIRYNGAMNDTEVESKIDELNTLYGL
jgi:hypothetical protein